MTPRNYSSTGTRRITSALAGALGLALLVPWANTRAADKASPAAQTRADSPDESQAVLESIASYVDAYNRSDSQAVAAHWSETGEWVSPSGARHQGKAAIEKALGEMFAESRGTTIDVVDPSVRLLSADAAVERGRVIVRTPGAADSESSYVAVHVKRDGRWKLDSVYETAAEEDAPAPSPLKELAWLVGEWSDASPEASASASIRWMKNKSFLNYSFQVSTPDADDLEGTQVIGWDPALGSIRSWMFDSDGGLGEGTWMKSGNSWIVKFSHVLPDGRRASATNVYTPVDADTIVWKSIGRKLDGQFLPNIDDVKLVRRRGAGGAEVAAAEKAEPATPKK